MTDGPDSGGETTRPQEPSSQGELVRSGEIPTPASVFAKVSRRTVWMNRTGEGFHDRVECAVRTNRSSPANAFLTALSAGARREDRDYRPPTDPEQIHDFAQLMAKIEFVGFFGQPRLTGDVNYLSDGVWEFRHGKRRLSYWDTAGDGTFSPKERVQDYRDLPEGRFSPEEPWWYPDMDPILRLGCGWEKDDQLAPPEKIAEALQIREEDVAHDRTNTA